MPDSLQKQILTWALEKESGAAIKGAADLIDCLEKHLFKQYEPTASPNPAFWSRFESFVNNVTDECDRKILFRLISEITFVGTEEFKSLYRTAFTCNTVRWILEELNIPLFAPESLQALNSEIQRTWFCPITDSMRINSFYHVNNISGIGQRPNFDFLARVIDDTSKIEKFMTDEGLHRLVLLEDFVGSGSQMEDAIQFAQALKSGKLPILICPLLICPEGHQFAQQFETRYSNITYDPVFELNPTSFIAPNPASGESNLFSEIRTLLERTYSQVCGGTEITGAAPYSCFGYRRTGSTTMMFSNCPDNTIPVIHHRSCTWEPVFPRASRV